jgi:hypothetical protein
VKRTGLALSAWESVPSGPLFRLTCRAGCPRATVTDRSSPGVNGPLMAANGPANRGQPALMAVPCSSPSPCPSSSIRSCAQLGLLHLSACPSRVRNVTKGAVSAPVSVPGGHGADGLQTAAWPADMRLTAQLRLALAIRPHAEMGVSPKTFGGELSGVSLACVRRDAPRVILKVCMRRPMEAARSRLPRRHSWTNQVQAYGGSGVEHRGSVADHCNGAVGPGGHGPGRTRLHRVR